MPDYFDFFNAPSPVSREVVARLWEAGHPKAARRGELITRQGQVQSELLLVEEGVQMSYLDHDGVPHVIAFTYAPSLSGIPESFCFQVPSPYHLQALTDSRFRAVPYAALQALFDESQALERAFRRLAEAVVAGIISRHLELRTLPMAARLQAFARRSPHLFRVVPHKHLASYLHISPTNFSKLYNWIVL